MEALIIDGNTIAVLLVGLLLFGFIAARKCINKLHGGNEPEDSQNWTVGDLKQHIKDFPDDMPFILMDTSTDDPEYANYSIRNENVVVDDYYIFDTPEHDEGIPAGKALYIYFDNVLNDDPIPPYEPQIKDDGN